MKDDRYELAERHDMSKEFIDWFFDNKKSDCGNVWLIAMAAMWEGWKASREELVMQLPKAISIEGGAYCTAHAHRDKNGEYLYRDEVIEVLNAAGVTVKSD